MIERKTYPIIKSFNLLYRVYIVMIVCFSGWAYIHGHLLSYSYQNELGIAQFDVPIDIVKTEIYGGVDILLDYYFWIMGIFIMPILFLIVHIILFALTNGKIHSHKWLLRPYQILSYMMISFAVMALILPLKIISNPIREGERIANEIIDKPDCEQLLIGSSQDSIINCKIIYFNKDYAVFMKDSIAYAMSLPNGSKAIRKNELCH